MSSVITALLYVLSPQPRTHMWQLDPHLQAVWSGANFVYVLTQEHSRAVVLIGSGSATDAGAIERHLKLLDRTLEDVAWVLLPCGHAAHTAGLQALPHAQVGASMAEAPLIWGQKSPRAPLQRLLLRRNGRARVHPEITPLVPGQTLSIGDETIDVVALSSHTMGSLGFVVHDVLVAGEALDTTTLVDDELFELPGFDEQRSARRERRSSLKQQLAELGVKTPTRSIADALRVGTLSCAAL